MELLEAQALPVIRFSKHAPTAAEAIGPSRTDIAMRGHSIPTLLMLRCAALSHHAVRTAARQAGLAIHLVFAEHRNEFIEELRSEGIDLIVVGPEGLTDIDVREVIERARAAQPSIPVILAGGRFGESDAIRILREGATEILQAGEMERLPSAIARALKVRQTAIVQSQAMHELDRSAGMLRENQKLITIGRLAASIAHEINNPLESVMNLLFLLSQEGDLSPNVVNYLTLAQRELERVAQISRQTLKFSRETTHPIPVRLEDLLEEVLTLYDRRVMEKNIRVDRQYENTEEANVYPGEMRQVLSNLVTNAIEALSPDGHLHLRIRSTRSWTDPGVRGIRVSIGDNGSGIPPEVQRRLGEPFFTTKGQRGTGLGLWVTRSIIQRYGGEIQLRSSTDPERHGTVFSIFLPTNMRPRMVDRSDDSGGDSGGTGSLKSFPNPGPSNAAGMSPAANPARNLRGA